MYIRDCLSSLTVAVRVHFRCPTALKEVTTMADTTAIPAAPEVATATEVTATPPVTSDALDAILDGIGGPEGTPDPAISGAAPEEAPGYEGGDHTRPDATYTIDGFKECFGRPRPVIAGGFPALSFEKTDPEKGTISTVVFFAKALGPLDGAAIRRMKNELRIIKSSTLSKKGYPRYFLCKSSSKVQATEDYLDI